MSSELRTAFQAALDTLPKPAVEPTFLNDFWRPLTALGGSVTVTQDNGICHLSLPWSDPTAPSTGWNGVHYGYAIAGRGRMDWNFATPEIFQKKFIDLNGTFIEAIPQDGVTGPGNTYSPVPWDWIFYFEMQYELTVPVALNGYTSKFLDAQVGLAYGPMDAKPSAHTDKSHHVKRPYMQVKPGQPFSIKNFDVEAHYQWAIAQLGLTDVGWIHYGTGPGVEGYRAKSIKADIEHFVMHD